MAEHKQIKYRRILYYYDELSRHKIDIDTAIEFMEYMFNVRPVWIMTIVKNSNRYNDLPLPHRDVDDTAIDSFVRKLYREARKQRNEIQKTDFENNEEAEVCDSQLKIFDRNS